MQQKTYNDVEKTVIKIIDNSVQIKERTEAQMSDKPQKQHTEVKISDEFNSLDLDSLDVVECLVEAEKEFNILLPDSIDVHMTTVEDLVNCVCETMGIKIPQNNKAQKTKKSVPEKPVNPVELAIKKEFVNQK